MTEKPERGDWLVVLDDTGRAIKVVEVVEVREEQVEGFELFPEDGKPVKTRLNRCLKFARPGEAEGKENGVQV